ncbi:DegT/DnrJ/EryC1/StrS family aminotransferase [Mesonia sp.]|uniref:DegT/DnrJ/EryC1/StrS family aminotransferase n=1 Tax=Mesonia sp. TaxID=1960830 RepID=UPI00176BAE03|nr:DegT/DnrJ/EryC1/StrS family aminotransferase [Mesonia sp.]HIB36795.1 DegT/DnrJ/EryC1/StrS family aminotransferase [Mesonia sp.]HIO26218.1 DegT/DnrJ/EryC1/StrS family aminotransferase [Flavobacteriaceae bacterium]
MPGFELFGDEERKEVNDVLESGILMRYGFDGLRNGHFKAKEFEQKFAEVMGVKHTQLTSSGTSALTVALASAGIGSGDEVILPTFTFVASFEAVLALGAVPILADVDDTLGLNAQAVEKQITDKTKAIMPVHMCGSIVDLTPLKGLANKYNILLIEDACQAIGGTYNGQKVGSIGDAGCFSFDFVKTITCGEGGALITNNKDIAENADKYQDHGHDHVGNDRGAETHPFLGYNYRISELHAAVGLGQLKKFDQILEKQRINYSILAEELKDIDGVTFTNTPKNAIPNYSFFNFFLPSEEKAREVISKLKNESLEACFYWYANNWHYYKQWNHLTQQKSLGKLSKEVVKQLQDFNNEDFSLSDKWLSRNISTLIKVSWTEEEMKTRAEKIASVIKATL